MNPEFLQLKKDNKKGKPWTSHKIGNKSQPEDISVVFHLPECMDVVIYTNELIQFKHTGNYRYATL